MTAVLKSECLKMLDMELYDNETRVKLTACVRLRHMNIVCRLYMVIEIGVVMDL